MKIINVLEKRSNAPEDEKVKIELKLYSLADDIEKQARNHLKRVGSILPEFDLHDESHSEKVIENIEELIGDEQLNKLSIYELFFLHLSAFLHDCAMAPAEWEITLLKMTEGTELYYENEYSVKHDLKVPLQLSKVITLINDNKPNLYIDFKEPSKWLFCPVLEKDLITELSELFIDYQIFRNGYSDQLRKIKSIEDFKSLNKSIRISFIRCNHHLRIEKYIKNLSKKFEQTFEQAAWGKKLSHDLALICRAHGENISFIEGLDVDSQYYGQESANLQFVAIMLRLGDIIHFSFDRAPLEIRTSKLFQSEYSFQQWAIKNNGVNYSIQKGTVSFKAYCDNPEDYFKLHEYLNLIEVEIQNYYRYERKWENKYIPDLSEKIIRDGVKNDEDVFYPVCGLHFTLNQKQIIELLMGVGLYKDKYACIRELYQNALDACRCIQGLLKTENKSGHCIIEFGLLREDDKVYLYCHDNGIGMTKNIIENYLLQIGNSYYNSPEFYRKQAEWDGNFTPTSQFGIGILSCFMIGRHIEITTKTPNSEIVACAIDGPHESFYYKTINKLDEEKIGSSGTIVKVLLFDEVLKELSDRKLEKLGLLLLNPHSQHGEDYKNYNCYFENWTNHLFKKVNEIVGVPFPKVLVQISQENGEKIEIISKPYLFKHNKLGLVDSDLDFVDYSIRRRFVETRQYLYSEIIDHIEFYIIFVELEGINYSTILQLPKPDFPYEDKDALDTIPKFGCNGLCIDGIKIGDNLGGSREEFYYLSALQRIGVINFVGSKRPQLSVDRRGITSWPEHLDEDLEKLTKKLLEAILEQVNEHISKYQLSPDSKEVNLIWKYLFSTISFGNTVYIDELAASQYGEIQWNEFDSILEEKISINEFIKKSETKIVSPNQCGLSIITKNMIYGKLLAASNIKVIDNTIEVKSKDFYKITSLRGKSIIDEYETLICADHWEGEKAEYDIISNLLPVIPKRLFDAYLKDHEQAEMCSQRGKLVYRLENGLTAFFKQNPLLINENIGIFCVKNHFTKQKTNSVYNFERRRAPFHLHEIN